MNHIQPKLIGQDPFDIERIENEILGHPFGGRWRLYDTDTVAAIDCALWDIVGKAAANPSTGSGAAR